MTARAIVIRRALPLAILAALIAFLSCEWSPSAGANSCVAVPPVKISGAFCGRVIDASGAIETDGQLRVVDEGGATIGHTSVTAKGDFKFPPLPARTYRVMTTAPGFRDYVGYVQILRSGQASCKKPATVVLGIQSCEGGIGNNKPPHFHEPGW
jgi:hypothetical protein